MIRTPTNGIFLHLQSVSLCITRNNVFIRIIHVYIQNSINLIPCAGFDPAASRLTVTLSRLVTDRYIKICTKICIKNMYQNKYLYYYYKKIPVGFDRAPEGTRSKSGALTTLPTVFKIITIIYHIKLGSKFLFFILTLNFVYTIYISRIILYCLNVFINSSIVYIETPNLIAFCIF